MKITITEVLDDFDGTPTGGFAIELPRDFWRYLFAAATTLGGSVGPGQAVAEAEDLLAELEKDRYPKTLPEITAAANKLAQSRAFAEFVSEFVEWPAAIEPEPPPLNPSERLIELLDEEVHDGLG